MKFKKLIVGSIISMTLSVPFFTGSSFAAMTESSSNNTFESATTIPSFYDFNETVSASIETVGDVDYFSFTPVVSGGYQIFGLGSTEVYGYLFDTDKTTVLDSGRNQTKGINEEFQFKLIGELQANKKYYIKVSHNSNGIGNYNIKIKPTIENIEKENNNTLAAANEFSYTSFNSSISASIFPLNDEDIYKFIPESSGSYTIESTGELDNYAMLYDSNSNYLTYNNDSGVNENFKIVYTLNANTSYYIKVSSLDEPYIGNGNGGYKIKITKNEVLGTDTEGNDFTTAGTITNNNVSGAINFNGDVDYFKFTAAYTGIHTFESTGCDIYGEIYDSNKKLIAYSEYGDLGNKIELNCEANKSYYIKARVLFGNPGKYELSIARGKELPVIQYCQQPYDWTCWASSAAMVASYFNSDTINRNTQIAKAYFNSTYPSGFNCPLPQGASDAVGKSVGDNVLGLSWKTEHRSEGLDGMHGGIVQNDVSLPYDTIKDYINNGLPIIIAISGDTSITGGGHANVVKGYKEQDGNQLIIVNDPWNGKEYTINYYSIVIQGFTTFYFGTPPVLSNDNFYTATTLGLSNEISASIENPGDVDYYKINLGGQTVFDIETFGTTDTYIEFYTPNYEYYGYDDDSGEGSNCKLTGIIDGLKTYYFKVRHKNNTSTGNYTLKIIPRGDLRTENESTSYTNNSISTSNDIPSVGNNVVGALSSGDIDFFRFIAPESGNYLIETTGTTDTFGSLFDSNESLIRSDDNTGIDNNFSIQYNLQAGKTYYVSVRHADNVSLGIYKIRIQKI